MADIPDRYDIRTYAIEVPEDRIAQHPAGVREQSRLMVLDRKTGKSSITSFDRIGSVLPEHAQLVANNTRVLPARLQGKKQGSGGKVEFLLLTPLPLISSETKGGGQEGEVEGLLRSSKPCRMGQRIDFADGLSLTVSKRLEYGRVQGRLRWEGDLARSLDRQGSMPLPPYIRREDDPGDRERYQTVYSRPDRAGSVAAPTAGLHFSSELIQELVRQGHGWAEVSLYVGYGTFSPVRVQDIRQHVMHSEYYEISDRTAAELREARRRGRPIVAVGTTTVRTLETVMHLHGTFKACAGWTDLFIHPGFEFKATDHMLTNFHLPGSSLILMVAAFAGRQNIVSAYRKAVQEKMRFYSYGDAMLIR